jgi:phosphate transport system substrate-binding protein
MSQRNFARFLALWLSDTEYSDLLSFIKKANRGGILMKIIKIKYPVVSLSLAIVLVISCQSNKGPHTYNETPTRGNIRIAVDEAYQLLADSEITTFESLYKYAEINPTYASEDSILQLFLADSVRLMITSRKLTENEEAYLKEKLIVPRTTQIAWDGLAFIVNRANPDSFLQYNRLKDVFTGEISSWNQINPGSKLGKLKIVFDNQGSSNVRMVIQKFKLAGQLPDYCYSANTNAQVIDYVESHPESIGIISVNWVSDPDDSITHAFLRRVKVVGITSEFDSEGDEYYKPHPAYIADKSYPFIREVYAISRETFAGLGRGFIQFVANDQGQRIVLKMGMVPATMPIRLVQIKKN